MTDQPFAMNNRSSLISEQKLELTERSDCRHLLKAATVLDGKLHAMALQKRGIRLASFFDISSLYKHHLNVFQIDFKNIFMFLYFYTQVE